eukprot:gnl/TRDRNA2_/TRDRNA2_147755_c2_seq1.p1 gnl/TRDRNA2_/TRDRNA2_147755_c2~~gnl/TRDRNA2_/TRDRNA2_147755_c2_seq1.p1  ORF type:complete len:193 (-),score=32.48 gnl/TRDRNA2_/TRDRNA2_147755_c2_seq1:29-607(-)
MHSELRSRGFRVASMSCDSLEDLLAWQKDIFAHFDSAIRLDFPMIADADRKIAVKWGLVDPKYTSEDIKNAYTMREVFVIGPDKKLKLMMNYPEAVGRNIHELLRVCDALQLSHREGVAIPANWPNNLPDDKEMTGACLVPSSLADDEVQELFPNAVEVRLPSQQRYMRLTHIDMRGKMPLCKGCVAMGGRM